MVESPVGMPLRNLMAVSEQFCDERKGDLGDKILQRGITGAEQVDAQFSQPHHDGLRVEVLARVRARE